MCESPLPQEGAKVVGERQKMENLQPGNLGFGVAEREVKGFVCAGANGLQTSRRATNCDQ